MIKAARSTGLIFFPAYDWEIDPVHPERKERLLYTQDQVLEEGLLDIEGISEFKAGLASERDISRAHFCVPDVKALSSPSHMVSAGGCIEAARLVLEKEVQKAFALVRPPGHHSMRVAQGGRGFCHINIEAVMVEWIRKNYPQIKRIAIVDTDCHHGDGTQDIYWHDPDVLFISLHQDGRTLYPGSGYPDEDGGPMARGMTINVPMQPGSGDECFHTVIRDLVRPVLEDFKPDLVINSAGQDNHYSDPLTNMAITAQGYAKLNELLDPDICVLEGGYSIENALPYINTGIIMALAGLDYSFLAEPDYDPERLQENPRNVEYTQDLCRELLARWRSRKTPICAKTHFTRSRNIYYDTDGINERQNETLRCCQKCAGTYSIDSKASNGYHVLCIHLPWNACDECRDQAETWFNDVEFLAYNEAYYGAFLQDMDRDEYLVKLL